MRFLFESSREFHTDMKDVPNDHSDFQRAIKVATRAFENIANLRDPTSRPVKKALASGGGRKRKAPEIRSTLFSWFVNVREPLKGRLPKRLFKLKAKELYVKWLIHNPTEPENQLRFESQWIIRNLQNVWTVRNFFIKKYDIDPQSLMRIRCHCTTMKTLPRKHWHSKGWIPMSKKTICFHVKERLFLPKHYPIPRST